MKSRAEVITEAGFNLRMNDTSLPTQAVRFTRNCHVSNKYKVLDKCNVEDQFFKKNISSHTHTHTESRQKKKKEVLQNLFWLSTAEWQITTVLCGLQSKRLLLFSQFEQLSFS